MKLDMSKMLITAIIISAMLGTTTSAYANKENEFKELFKDAVFGGLAGTLVGGALTVFTKKPLDHLDRIGYGTASGIIAGAVYGTVHAAGKIAMIEVQPNGSVKIAIPKFAREVEKDRHHSIVTAKANLMSFRF